MDAKTAKETTCLIATLIGEIMEDSVGIALAPPAEAEWPAHLQRAGEDIAALAMAVAIVRRRAEGAFAETSP